MVNFQKMGVMPGGGIGLSWAINGDNGAWPWIWSPVLTEQRLQLHGGVVVLVVTVAGTRHRGTVPGLGRCLGGGWSFQ